MTLSLPFKGLLPIDCHVLRPITTAFLFDSSSTDFVIRRKWAYSLKSEREKFVYNSTACTKVPLTKEIHADLHVKHLDTFTQLLPYTNYT